MSDKFNGFTVVLENDTHDFTADEIAKAIRLMKHVISVVPHVADLSHSMAVEQAKHEIRKKIWEVL
jgi:hypothetical protein